MATLSGLDSNTVQFPAAGREASARRTQGSGYTATPLLETLLGGSRLPAHLMGTQNSHFEGPRNSNVQASPPGTWRPGSAPLPPPESASRAGVPAPPPGPRHIPNGWADLNPL